VATSDRLLSQVLSEFARTMLIDFDVKAILDVLVRRIVDILPISAAGVTLITDATAPRRIAASDESALRFEQLQTDLGEGPCIVAYRSGVAVSIADVHSDARFPRFAAEARAAGLGAVFTFPLHHGSGRLGALDLYRGTTGLLTDIELTTAQTLADVTAAYLVNAQARVALRDFAAMSLARSMHDPLTGLPNRTLLLELLDKAMNRSRRTGATAALLFVDLDRFKVVNDEHGHRAGDDLLVAVAQVIGACLRNTDTLARLAGDEFVILCESLDNSDQAEALATRIVDALAGPFVVAGGTVALSASIGVAYASQADHDPARLLAGADVAMYEAKRSGGGGHRIFSGDHHPHV
jgi:diguanylate cyclase (GGDEF)-like protein